MAQDENKNIEVNAEMQGNLTFKDPVNLKINKNFKGTLDTCGSLAIGENSVVEANITGDSVIIAGKVQGDVTANKVLVLMPTAVLKGNIITPKLNVVEGAVFEGHCRVTEGLMDVHELAGYLEIDFNEIERMANAGEIPGVKNGETWRFDKTQIDEWAASGKLS